MSGTYAAVIPLFPAVEERDTDLGVGSEELAALPSLEDTICYLRWRHPEMIESLDKRMERQLKLVESLLTSIGWTIDRLRELSLDRVRAIDDETLTLCWHILRDIEYIDSLR